MQNHIQTLPIGEDSLPSFLRVGIPNGLSLVLCLGEVEVEEQRNEEALEEERQDL